MKNLFLIGLATILLLSACKKKDPEASLPAATQVGANTGGYLRDGQPVKATGRPGSSNILSSVKPIPPAAGGFLNDSMLCVQLYTIQDENRYHLTLFVRYHGPGIYQLNETTPRFGGASLSALRNHAFLYQDCKSSRCAVEEYRTDSLHTGTLTLTYVNQARGIVAGLFKFTGYDAHDKKTTQVSQGRFDLQECP